MFPPFDRGNAPLTCGGDSLKIVMKADSWRSCGWRRVITDSCCAKIGTARERLGWKAGGWYSIWEVLNHKKLIGTSSSSVGRNPVAGDSRGWGLVIETTGAGIIPPLYGGRMDPFAKRLPECKVRGTPAEGAAQCRSPGVPHLCCGFALSWPSMRGFESLDRSRIGANSRKKTKTIPGGDVRQVEGPEVQAAFIQGPKCFSPIAMRPEFTHDISIRFPGEWNADVMIQG